MKMLSLIFIIVFISIFLILSVNNIDGEILGKLGKENKILKKTIRNIERENRILKRKVEN